MPQDPLYHSLFMSVAAGIAASFACGLGALPLGLTWLDPARHRGLAYGFAGGLMFSASVYNLIAPAAFPGGGEMEPTKVLSVLVGILSGAAFLWAASFFMPQAHGPNAGQTPTATESAARLKRMRAMIFLTMLIHSIPEGVAVGVGYTSQGLNGGELGRYIALAIAIHNIPEGLAVAIPMRASGKSLSSCFWAATLTSLPQPIAAVPAVLAAWFFTPLMPLMMGFAAGSMIFLIVLELIPEALEADSAMHIAWAFTIGFCSMLLMQLVL